MAENNIIINDITSQEWYSALIEELSACIVETSFNARDAIIQGKHFIGKEILAREDKFTQAGYLKCSEQIALSLNKSQRDIEQCIQFARKYPDLSLLPQGKAISWHYISQELLSEHTLDTLESKSKPITKADLMHMLKSIKDLLQHEFEKTKQDNPDSFINTGDFIKYLQDQFNKIIGELKLE